MLLRRLLLTKQVEVYEIKENLYDEVIFYLILLDYKRPSQYEDFSHIVGFEKEDFTSRDNYIQAIILYNDNITESEKEETYEIASGFLEDKDDCDWSMKYEKGDFDKLRVIGVNNKELLSQINEIVASAGFTYDLSNIELTNFKYLVQN